MKELTGKTIFVVEADWQYEGEGGHRTYLFSDWDRALEAFEKLIDYEKKNLLAADSIKSDDVEYGNDEDDSYSFVIETSSGVNFRSWSWYEKGFYNETRSEYILHAVVVDEEIKLY